MERNYSLKELTLAGAPALVVDAMVRSDCVWGMKRLKSVGGRGRARKPARQPPLQFTSLASRPIDHHPFQHLLDQR